MAANAKPTPPDDHEGNMGATVEDWHEYKDLYSTWVETATDEELVAEMVAIPEEGRPLSPSEAWRFHQCELRRRRPSTKQTRRTTKKQEDG